MPADTPVPDRNSGEQREFQLTLDGQQVATERGFGSQPRYSQDAIAEFQFISNRFDATHGPVVGRAGARRHALGHQCLLRLGPRQLPRQPLQRREPGAESRGADRQPADRVHRSAVRLLRDQLHFFGHFEYEREPRVSIWNTPFPRFNVELEGNDSVKLGGVRLDYQLSPGIRLMGKVSQGAQVPAVRRRQPESSGRDRVPGRRQQRIPRAVHAGDQQPAP